MDGGAWRVTVRGVAKSQTWLSHFTFFLHLLPWFFLKPLNSTWTNRSWDLGEFLPWWPQASYLFFLSPRLKPMGKAAADPRAVLWGGGGWGLLAAVPAAAGEGPPGGPGRPPAVSAQGWSQGEDQSGRGLHPLIRQGSSHGQVGLGTVKVVIHFTSGQIKARREKIPNQQERQVEKWGNECAWRWSFAG